MQSAAMSLSSSAATSLLKTRTPSRNPNPRICSIPRSVSASSVQPRSISIRPSFSSDLWASLDAFPVLYTRSHGADVASRSAAGKSAGEKSADASGSSLQQTLQLGSLFGLWYLFNIYFNIYNKQVLKFFPFPMAMTTADS